MSNPREYLPAVETHLIRSTFIDQTFQVHVMQPTRLRGEQARFPVVFATDGNFAFDALKGISYGLQSVERASPRFILVGIGYPSHDPKAGIMLRCRDFTWPGYPRFSTVPPPIEGVLVPPPGSRDFDGADEFQRFLADELIPFVDAQYDTAPGERIYFGHSAGGGFGLYSLFTRPELFKSYIISSAATFYDGDTSAGVRYDAYDFIAPLAKAFASAPGSEKHLLYLSAGSEEEFEPGLEAWHITSSCYRLGAYLKASAPHLRVVTEIFPTETHITAWVLSFIHGIQTVFGRRFRECP